MLRTGRELQSTECRLVKRKSNENFLGAISAPGVQRILFPFSVSIRIAIILLKGQKTKSRNDSNSNKKTKTFQTMGQSQVSK